MKKHMLKGFLLLLLCLYFISCSTEQKAPSAKAPKATEKMAREFRDAMTLYKNKKTQEAFKKLINYTQKHPANDLTDDAYYFIGQIYYEQNDFFKASRYWTAITDGTTYSEYYDRALVGAALCQNQLGHPDEALAIISRFEIKPDTKEVNLTAQALELSSKLKVIKGQGYGALEDILRARDFRKTPQEKSALVYRAEEIVNNHLNKSDLERVVAQEQFAIVEAAARYKLGTMFYDEKSWPAAKMQFEAIIQKFPGSSYANKAQQYSSFVDSQEKVDSRTIGVVLPLSGKYSTQGYKVLRGIQMATHIFDRGSYRLAIVDSEGSAEVAKKAVDRLVGEDHVVAILGDVAGKTAQAVAQRAQELGVPCMTLSQKQGLTEIGEFIFRNNLTPDMQMRSLVTAAMKNRGYKKFAILYPNDPYGTEYATAFWDYVLLNGGQITAAQTYAPEETDFRQPIQRMVGTFYVEEDRGKELALRFAEWKKTRNPKTARDKPKDLMPPVIDFDAIFIPDSPKALGQISSMLAFNDVDKIPLLGTNLWNTPQAVERAGKYLNNALFVDEASNEDLSPAAKRFANEFQTKFGYKPDVFEMQGYDSTMLVLSALQSTSTVNRKSVRDTLSTTAKVAGSTGLLSVSPTRDVEKTLIPLTVLKGQIVKADN